MAISVSKSKISRVIKADTNIINKKKNINQDRQKSIIKRAKKHNEAGLDWAKNWKT